MGTRSQQGNAQRHQQSTLLWILQEIGLTARVMDRAVTWKDHHVTSTTFTRQRRSWSHDGGPLINPQ